MSGMKWPHQTLPRPLWSIVDSQVQLWEMRQEHPAGAFAEAPARGTRAGQESALGGTGKNKVRHPWLHYWGDAIVAELIRIGQPCESGEAFLNDGMKEEEPAPAPRLRPKCKLAKPVRSRPSPNHRS